MYNKALLHCAKCQEGVLKKDYVKQEIKKQKDGNNKVVDVHYSDMKCIKGWNTWELDNAWEEKCDAR